MPTLVHRLKLTQTGNSVVVVPPKEILARPKMGRGSKVLITHTTAR